MYPTDNNWEYLDVSLEFPFQEPSHAASTHSFLAHIIQGEADLITCRCGLYSVLCQFLINLLKQLNNQLEPSNVREYETFIGSYLYFIKASREQMCYL
jgi:hypothetical protein